jgi:hypothetical protein
LANPCRCGAGSGVFAQAQTWRGQQEDEQDFPGRDDWHGVVVGNDTWFLRVFFSKKDSLETRAKLASAVVNFLRIKRHWIANDRTYSLQRTSESRQAFKHAILQLESAALKIQLRCEENARADKNGSARVPVCLSKSGSDCCESAFSKLDGYGATRLNRRNCNADGALEMAGGLLQLAKYEYGSEHKLVFTRVNKNLGIDMTDIEEDPRRARCGTGSAAVPS